MNATLANIEKDSRILVTGGFGFIGSRLIERLNSLGFYNIDVIDDLKEDNQKLASRLFFSEHVNKNKWINLSNKSYKFIYHFGAFSSTKASFDDCNKWNYEFSKDLFRYFDYKKFVFAGSASIYQDSFSDNHQNLKSLCPKSNYSISKLMFKKWLYNNGHLNKSLVCNFFNVFGPNEWFKNDMASYPFKCFERIIGGLDFIDVFKVGDVFPQRDFIFVDDVLDKVLCLTGEDKYGMYNIGNGISIKWDQFANIIRNKLQELFKKDININVIEKDTNSIKSLNKSYQTHTLSDNTKINAAIGSKNKTFEEIKVDIENYLDWLYKNADYYLD